MPLIDEPRIEMSPPIMGSSPLVVISVVVFPAPFGPKRATTSPGATVRFRSRTTGIPL